MSKLLLMWLLVCAQCTKAYSTDQDILAKIDNMVNKTMACYGVPGMNLVLAQGDQILLSKGYGYANVARNTPVTTKTMFLLASTTKAFVATTLAHVVADTNNNVTWDSPARDAIGDWFYLNDAYRTQQVNLKDLLAHRVGLPGNNPVRIIGLSREELLKKLRFFETTKPFRDEWLYHNILYGVAGFMAEKITGKTWEEICREKIYVPLGMNSSTFFHLAQERYGEFATPYIMYNGTLREVSMDVAGSYYGSISSPGGVSSNAEDMSKWLLFHLSGGQNQAGEQVINKAHLEDTYKPLITIRGRDTILRPAFPVSGTFREKYGLGWNVGQYRGYRSLMHTGNMNGFHSMVSLLPDKQIGFYMSLNGPSTSRSGTIREVLQAYATDLMLGETPWLNETTACTFPAPWEPSNYDNGEVDDVSVVNYNSSRPLEEYTGLYGNYGYGNVSIVLNTTTQTLELIYGPKGRWLLHPTAMDDVFTGEGQEPFWYWTLRNSKFATKGGNEIATLTLPGFENSLPPVFEKNVQMSSAPSPPELGPWSTAVPPTCAPCTNKADLLLPTYTLLLLALYFLSCSFC
ncbi:unnamed protein product [Owenia fusiformis]|uniref:Uncharacterized protein n=1 Tax=Owenia fusiformis TaxID=6347 RepID=A0A8J1UN16_OWEFU|nr:unnamed protein product [Owenia fusiformis]